MFKWLNLKSDTANLYPWTTVLRLNFVICANLFLLQGDDDEEHKEKLPLSLVKDEPRGRRQPQKQGSAIDLDIGPPLEPNQVWTHLSEMHFIEDPIFVNSYCANTMNYLVNHGFPGHG